MIVDFCAEESASVKSFAIKKYDQIKVTTRFLSGKMLMFAKLSLMSFIYEMLETFCFPDKKIQENFWQVFDRKSASLWRTDKYR